MRIDVAGAAAIVLAGGTYLAAGGGAAAAAEDRCDAVLKLLHSTVDELHGGDQHFRQLPILVPGRGKALALDMTMERRDGIFVGRYEVDGVPVLAISPRSSNHTTAYVLDPATEKNVPVPPECLARRELIYGGTLWQLSQGDRIVSKLTSKLNFLPESVTPPKNGGVPCNTTNQHVHGMLVVPTQGDAARGKSYGDYIFDVTGPAGTPTDHDTCMTSAAGAHSGHSVFNQPMQYDIPIPPHKPPYGDFSFASGSHPSGLFWYHPHPHGYSRTQLTGGTSGLITVGNLCDYVRLDGRRCLLPARVDILDMGLKDVQVTAVPGASGKYQFAADYDSSRCSAPPASGHYQGECPFQNGKWLFTVNGMLYPVVTASAGRPQVWRLANTSPNVTYQIRVAQRAADGTETAERFRILSLDGIQAQTDIQKSTLLMMPSSRAELLFDFKPGTYYVEQLGYNTGIGDQGDTWPAIDLATVVAGSPSISPNNAYLTSADLPHLQIGKISEPAVFAAPAAAVAPRSSLKPACTTTGERHIYFVHQDPPPKEIFGLLAAVRRDGDGALIFFDQNGAPVVSTASKIYNQVKTLPNGVAFESQPFGNVCTVLGRDETWVLENWTAEDHNFHIHQSRFLVDATKPVQLSKIDIDAMTQRGAAAMEIDRAKAQNNDRALLERLFAAGSGYAESYHDNIPVPHGSGTCDGTPDNAGCKISPVTIKIRFNRKEQVGAFVYHCHILEHEDGGMMATVRVCDPSKRKGERGADPACFAN